MCQYLMLFDPEETGAVEFVSRNTTTGGTTLGKVMGPDGKPFFHVDAPHGAPSQHVFCYDTAIIVGAGIGVTPCSSIMRGVINYRWKKGFSPNTLYFFWVAVYPPPPAAKRHTRALRLTRTAHATHAHRTHRAHAPHTRTAHTHRTHRTHRTRAARAACATRATRAPLATRAPSLHAAADGSGLLQVAARHATRAEGQGARAQ